MNITQKPSPNLSLIPLIKYPEETGELFDLFLKICG